MSTRNLKIDTLRGLACVLLVTYHVIGAVLRRVPSIGSWGLSESITRGKHRPAAEAGTP
jgi:uncharacterized membrane protein